MAAPASPGSYDKFLEARRNKELARSARERVQQEGLGNPHTDARLPQPDVAPSSPTIQMVEDTQRVSEAGLFSSPLRSQATSGSGVPPQSPLMGIPPVSPRSPTIPGSPIAAHPTGASPVCLASPTFPIGIPEDSFGEGSRFSQLVGAVDREKYEQKQQQLIAELHRLQEVLSTEAAVRRQLEDQNEELRNQLKILQEMPQLQNLDWKHLPGPDKANALVQQVTALREMVLKKVCYQCGLPMNCVPCTPYPVCGLELSEGHNYGIDGVCVISVKDKGPADKAGIVVGDIITKFNNAPVPKRELFKKELHCLPPMHPCNFELYREADGKKRWIHMAGRIILGSGEHFPTSHRTIFHCLGADKSVEMAPLGGSPSQARERGDQRATSPPPYKTSPRGPASPRRAQK